MNGKRTERVLRAIDPDELAGAVGGKAITAEELRVAACPAHHANASPTGREREASFLLFWHRRQREYRCPDCGFVWWRDENGT
ncbi:MAG: hypothetical protein IKO83_08605 [Oscillospiraceae bacterium]|nr:hypothetical protein [Oscillospiraceae bacterium]